MYSGCQFRAQHLERCLVGSWSGAHNEIYSQYWDKREDLAPHNFPKSSLEAIALHDGPVVLRNDDANPWMTQKGSEDPNLEVFGSSSLPFTKDLLQIRPPGQTKPPGVGSMLRRRRTWLATGQ